MWPLASHSGTIRSFVFHFQPMSKAITSAPSGISMPSEITSKKSSQLSMNIGISPAISWSMVMPKKVYGAGTAPATPVTPPPMASSATGRPTMRERTAETHMILVRLEVLPFSRLASMRQVTMASNREMDEVTAAMNTRK